MKNFHFKSLFTVAICLSAAAVLAQPDITNITRPDDTVMVLRKDACECDTGDCRFEASELTARLRIETSNTMDRVEFWDDTEMGQLEPEIISRSADDKVWIVEIAYGADIVVPKNNSYSFTLTIRAYQTNSSYRQWNTGWELHCGSTTRTSQNGLVVSEAPKYNNASSAEAALEDSASSEEAAIPGVQVTPEMRADIEALRNEAFIAATVMIDQAVDYLASVDFSW